MDFVYIEWINVICQKNLRSIADVNYEVLCEILDRLKFKYANKDNAIASFISEKFKNYQIEGTNDWIADKKKTRNIVLLLLIYVLLTHEDDSIKSMLCSVLSVESQLFITDFLEYVMKEDDKTDEIINVALSKCLSKQTSIISDHGSETPSPASSINSFATPKTSRHRNSILGEFCQSPNALAHQLKEKQKEINRLKEFYEFEVLEKNETIQNLEKTVEVANIELEKKQGKIIQLNDEISKLNEENLSFRSNIEILRNKTTNSQSDENSEKYITELHSEIFDYQEKLEQCEKEIANSKLEQLKLIEQIEQLERFNADKEFLNEELKEELAKLQNKICHYEDINENLRLQLSPKDPEKSSEENIVMSLQFEMDYEDLKYKNKALSEELNKLKTELSNEIDGLHSQLENSLKSYEYLSDRYNDAINKNNDLRDEIEILKNDSSEQQKLIDELKNRTNILTEENIKIEKEIFEFGNKYNAEIVAQTAVNNDLRAQIEKLKRDIAARTAEFENSSKLQTENIEELENKCSNYVAELNRLNDELQVTVNDYRQMLSKKNEFETTNDALNVEIKHLKMSFIEKLKIQSYEYRTLKCEAEQIKNLMTLGTKNLMSTLTFVSEKVVTIRNELNDFKKLADGYQEVKIWYKARITELEVDASNKLEIINRLNIEKTESEMNFKSEIENKNQLLNQLKIDLENSNGNYNKLININKELENNLNDNEELINKINGEKLEIEKFSKSVLEQKDKQIREYAKKCKNYEFADNHLKSEIIALISQNVKLENDLFDKLQLIDDMQNQVENSENQLEIKSNRVNELESDVTSKLECIDQLNIKKSELETNFKFEIEMKDELLKEYKSKCSEYSTAIEDVKIRFKNSERNYSEILDKYNQLETINKGLCEKIKKMENNLSDKLELINKIDVEKIEIEKFSKAVLEQKDEQIREYAKKCENYELDNNQIKSELITLKSQKNKLENDIFDKLQLIDDMRHQVVNSENQLEIKSNRVNELESDVTSKLECIDQLNIKKAELETNFKFEIEMKDELLEEYKSKCSEYSTAIEDIKIRFKNSERNYSEILDKYNQLETINKGLHEGIKKLENDLSDKLELINRINVEKIEFEKSWKSLLEEKDEQIREYTKKCDNYELDNNQLKSELSALKCQKNKLEENLRSTNNMMSELGAEKAELEIKSNNEKMELETNFKTEIEMKDQLLTDYKSKCSEYLSEIAELKTELKNSNCINSKILDEQSSRNSVLCEQIKELENNLNKISIEKTDLKSIVEQNRALLEKYTAECSTYKSLTDKLQTELCALKMQKLEHENILLENSKLIEDLTSEIANSKNELKILNDMSIKQTDEIEIKEKEINQLKNEKSKLETNFKTENEMKDNYFKTEIEMKENFLTDFKRKFEDKCRELKILNTKLSSLDADVSNKVKSIDLLNIENDQLKIDLNNINSNYNVVLDKHDKLEITNEILSKEVKELENSLLDKTELINKINIEKTEFEKFVKSDLELKIQLECDILLKSQIIDDMKSHQDMLNAQIDGLKTDAKENAEIIHQLKTEKAQLEVNVKSEIETKDALIKDYESKYSKLSVVNDQLKIDLEERRSNYYEILNKHDKQESINLSLSKQIKDLENDLQENMELLSKMRLIETEFEAILKEKDELKAEYDILKCEKLNLESDLSEKFRLIEDMKSQICNVENHYKTMLQKNYSTYDNENQKLKAELENLDKSYQQVIDENNNLKFENELLQKSKDDVSKENNNLKDALGDRVRELSLESQEECRRLEDRIKDMESHKIPEMKAKLREEILKEVRPEYETQLERAKIQLGNVIIEKVKMWEKKEMKYKQTIEAHEEHIRNLCSQFWNVGDQYLKLKESNDRICAKPETPRSATSNLGRGTRSTSDLNMWEYKVPAINFDRRFSSVSENLPNQTDQRLSHNQQIDRRYSSVSECLPDQFNRRCSSISGNFPSDRRFSNISENLIVQVNINHTKQSNVSENICLREFKKPAASINSKLSDFCDGSSSSSYVKINRKKTAPSTIGKKFLPKYGKVFPTADEDNEVFDNAALSELKQEKSIELDSIDQKRLSVLQERNALCKPHLKSSYPLETQFLPPNDANEDQIKLGNVDNNELEIENTAPTGGVRNRKNRNQTSYKRPGPPTPSKNGGRSSQASTNTPKNVLREANGSNDTRRRSFTPRRIFSNLFSSRGHAEVTTTPSAASKKPEVTEQLKNNKIFSGYIPLDKLIIKHNRSSGPGGQHLHATNSKVEVRFHVASADWIHDDIKTRLLEEKKNSLTKDGYWVIKSEKTRSQQLNLADALQRIRTIIYNLVDTQPKEPSPETEERIRKRKEKANRERLRMKRFNSLLHKSRSIDDI